jgi:hypothetical protein
MFGKGCPRADVLESLVRGRHVPPRVVEHVEQCATCSAIVANLQRDEQLLSELREAAESALDDDTRREILDACKSAVLDDPATDP